MLPLLLSLACAPFPDGLRSTPPGDGPVVRVDWDAEPLPDIPFPNDLATRVDRHSVTGLRVNVPTEAHTEEERDARRKINTLDGFGIYAPLAVGFDKPLDLDNIAARHMLDRRPGVDQFDDDVFFVIDVTPGSPTYLQPVMMDVGQGRYPMDVARTDRYFPNDTRASEPSVIFDTYDEDKDGDGVLDWGEDIDNDGYLDIPNVWPEGGDHREDMLTFYEKITDTFITRPARPLREKTTYAVVLTERMVGTDGSPVRSPWDYVHHLRQTEALEPIQKALPDLGLTLDDVAFAWTFTTGNQTGDLVDARRGLLGQGPLASVDGIAKEGVRKAHQMNEIEGENPVILPLERLLGPLTDLGVFEGLIAEIIAENYLAFGDGLIGGEFMTANFFGDDDQVQAAWPLVDDSNDYWQIDSHNGTYSARAERVAFTCVRAKGVPQPAPVVMFGHGYGSNRFEFLTFAWVMNRLGFTACALDYPGHGLGLDPEQEDLALTYLTNAGLLPAWTHLSDGRARDLDNDGRIDSGGDQWSADAFHTRDMVRQGALDHAQFFDSLKACGTGTMTLPDGSSVTSCDWDNDGTPDFGGPDVDYYAMGGSLGGINLGVALAITDGVKGWAPVVPGGGLLDIAFRTQIGGAVEAMHGRLMSPLFLGIPLDDGRIQITQMVNSVADMVSLPVAVVDSLPANGKVIIENLVNGEVREGWIPPDGRFRLGIPADAATAWEKAELAGLNLENGPTPNIKYMIEDPTTAGDALRIRFLDEAGEEVYSFDSWETEVTVQGVTFPAGSAMVAAASGLGHVRASPQARRVAFVFANILEPGDPIAYARAWDEEPFELLGGQPRNVLLLPTPGDPIVNISTGIALGRAAGWYPDEVDDRYGMSIDQFLIDRKVVQGLEEFGPYTCADGSPCLFDADDLDEGLDDNNPPSDAPLRVTIDHSAGQSGMRLPYASPRGVHGYDMPEEGDSFYWAVYALDGIASYFAHGGQEIIDDVCLEDFSCDFIPALPDDGGGR